MYPDASHYAVLDGSGPETPMMEDSFLHDLGVDGITSTPRWVAGAVLGAIATLILLKKLGFRFSFGVGVGGGS